jgi:hypothetical protein
MRMVWRVPSAGKWKRHAWGGSRCRERLRPRVDAWRGRVLVMGISKRRRWSVPSPGAGEADQVPRMRVHGRKRPGIAHRRAGTFRAVEKSVVVLPRRESRRDQLVGHGRLAAPGGWHHPR